MSLPPAFGPPWLFLHIRVRSTYKEPGESLFLLLQWKEDFRLIRSDPSHFIYSISLSRGFAYATNIDAFLLFNLQLSLYLLVLIISKSLSSRSSNGFH